MAKPKTHLSVTTLTTVYRKGEKDEVEVIQPGQVKKLPFAEAEDLIRRGAASEYTGPARAAASEGEGSETGEGEEK